MKKEVLIYTNFERFWHWTQALLIFLLIVTGFEIHSSFELLGFDRAVRIHDVAAWAFLMLIVFAIFWHFISGMWKQYIPTTQLLMAQINYYILGIFKNAPHPTKKTIISKLNPLQRLVYLALKILVIPVQVVSGFLYLYYQNPDNPININALEPIAIVHTFGAFLLIAFVIVHVYLITTGHTVFSNLKAMITGYEEVDDDVVKTIVEDVIAETGQKIISKGKKGESDKDVKDIIREALIETEGKVAEDKLKGQKKK